MRQTMFSSRFVKWVSYNVNVTIYSTFKRGRHSVGNISVTVKKIMCLHVDGREILSDDRDVPYSPSLPQNVEWKLKPDCINCFINKTLTFNTRVFVAQWNMRHFFFDIHFYVTKILVFILSFPLSKIYYKSLWHLLQILLMTK